jgi:hypothetical protein
VPPRLWISCYGCTFYAEVAQPPNESQCNMSLCQWKNCRSITPHATCHVSFPHLQIYRDNRLGRFLVTLGRVTCHGGGEGTCHVGLICWVVACKPTHHVCMVRIWSFLCNNKVECWVNPCHPTHLLTNYRALWFCSTWWSEGIATLHMIWCGPHSLSSTHINDLAIARWHP